MPVVPLSRRPPRSSVLVLGDLLLDVILAPRRPLVAGSDVPGRISLCQGGAGATTARWLARLGVETTLVTAVGRDGPGRALIELVRDQGVEVHAARPAGVATGRTGVLLLPTGERSLVVDRGAADTLAPDYLKPAWFEGVSVVHLSGYALLAEPLSSAARAAARQARTSRALLSLDLAASEPVAEGGRRTALTAIRDLQPDILFGTPAEAQALLPGRQLEGLLELAPTVVVKRGSSGATALARRGDTKLRLEIATESKAAADPTGAGDAFNAGFLAAWLDSPLADGQRVALQRAVAAGHRAAARHLAAPRPEVRLG